jgi:hypothetical protein
MDVDEKTYAMYRNAGALIEEIPHSGSHGETPINTFDNTSLPRAVREGILTTDKVPVTSEPPAHDTLNKSRRLTKKQMVGLAAVTGVLSTVIGGGLYAAKRSGDTDTEPRSESTASATANPGETTPANSEETNQFGILVSPNEIDPSDVKALQAEVSTPVGAQRFENATNPRLAYVLENNPDISSEIMDFISTRNDDLLDPETLAIINGITEKQINVYNNLDAWTNPTEALNIIGLPATFDQRDMVGDFVAMNTESAMWKAVASGNYNTLGRVNGLIKNEFESGKSADAIDTDYHSLLVDVASISRIYDPNIDIPAEDTVQSSIGVLKDSVSDFYMFADGTNFDRTYSNIFFVNVDDYSFSDGGEDRGGADLTPGLMTVDAFIEYSDASGQHRELQRFLVRPAKEFANAVSTDATENLMELVSLQRFVLGIPRS